MHAVDDLRPTRRKSELPGMKWSKFLDGNVEISFGIRLRDDLPIIPLQNRDAVVYGSVAESIGGGDLSGPDR
jgi:hypothetical protein